MSDRIYRLAAWLKLRRMKLQQDPLCEWCKRTGKLEPATDVDHIVPVSKGGAPLDLDALQSLCHACHSRKTQRDMGNTDKPMKGCDVRGVPLDPNHPWNREDRGAE